MTRSLIHNCAPAVLAAVLTLLAGGAATGQSGPVGHGWALTGANSSDYRPFAKGLEALLEMPVQYEGRIAPLSAVASVGHRAGSGAARLWDSIIEGSRRGGPDETYPSALYIAPIYPTAARWLSRDEIRGLSAPDRDEQELAGRVDSVEEAAAEGRASEFNERAKALRAFVETHARALGVDTGRVKAEAALERLRPFVISALAYLTAGVITWILIARGASMWFAAIPCVAAFALNAASVAFYGYVARRIPVNNSYEGMLVFSAALGALAAGSLASARSRPAAVMGAFFAAAVLLVAEFSPIERGITPPVPVLDSLWLQVHVLTCFIAYAAFALSFVSSWLVVVARDKPLSNRYDAISYRCVLLGFIFLTAGILTGAAWAKQAWGRYWGFDPKETWALVTWLIYAAYLHLGIVWAGKPLVRAAAAILGFAAAMFTFFGVNYLLKGLHSYA